MPDDMAFGGGTWVSLMRTLNSATSGLNMAMGQHNAFRSEKHHIFSNKNKTYTPQYEEVMDCYGMNLKDTENVVPLEGHSGRHTNVYHELMLSALHEIDTIAGGDVGIFKEGIGVVREYLIDNPGLPYAK